MECKKCKENLIFFYESSLKKSVMDNIRQHIENCTDCKKAYKQIARSFEVINKEKQIVLNPFIATRIIQEIENESNIRNVGIIRKLQLAFYTLMVVFALSIGILLGNSYQLIESNGLATNQIDELFINDFEQENIELTIITDNEND